MKLSDELLETLSMVLSDRRDEAHTKIYDAYAQCVSYQHFATHTKYIEKCVRELDSIQRQLDEVTILRGLTVPNTDDVSEQYERLHESHE